MRRGQSSGTKAKGPATPIAGAQIQQPTHHIPLSYAASQLELPLAQAQSARVPRTAKFLSRRELIASVAAVLIMLDTKEAA